MAYKLTTLELRGGVLKPLLCDGPLDNSPWTAIYNCLQLKFFSLLPEQSIGSHLKEQDLRGYLLRALKKALNRAKSTQNDQAVVEHAKSVEKELLDLVASHSHDVQLHIPPALESTTTFDEALAYWIFQYLPVGLLHGWVINPADESKLLGAVLPEDLRLVLDHGGVSNADRSLIESLLNGEELTSYGFSCLKEDVGEDQFGIFYQKGGYSVIHAHKGSLLLLETNREFLERYPQARWKVFEEGNEDNIYLTGRYLPANDQPNVERAKQWYCKNLAAETSSSNKEPTQKDGATGSSNSKEHPQKDGGIGRKPSRGQRRRAAQKARKAQTTSHEESQGSDIVDNRVETQDAVPEIADQLDAVPKSQEISDQLDAVPNSQDIADQLAVPETVSDDPPASASSDEKKYKKLAAEIVDNGGDTKDTVLYSHETAACESTAEPDIKGWVDERGEAGITEAEVPSTVSDNPPASASSEEKKCEKLAAEIVHNGGDTHDAVPEIVHNPSTPRTEFLEFLLKFLDGSSKLDVPYFDGIAESMKSTGSCKLYVPYRFVKKYNRTLALQIRDQYERIEEDLLNAVGDYLVHHRMNAVKAYSYPELEFFDLPTAGRIRSLKSFVQDNAMLESYYNSSDGVEKSPSSVARNMSLSYLNKLLKKFKNGRCFGGKWSEDNLEVVDDGSDFVIDSEDEKLSHEGALADLIKYCETILVHLKDENGKMPPYYIAFEGDCKEMPNHEKDPVQWALFLEYMSSPLLLKAPLVRSAFLCNLYRVAAARRTGAPGIYVPLYVKCVPDWQSNAKAHWLLRKVYDYSNYYNGPHYCSFLMTHWSATYWSLIQFCRHFIEHALVYTKKDDLSLLIVDISVLDIVLARQLEESIAKAVKYLVFNCDDFSDIFSSAWRHYVASECADKPRKISESEEELVKIVSEVLVGPSLPKKPQDIAWAYTEIGIVDKHTHQSSFKSVIMANLNLIDFVEHVRNLGFQAKLVEDPQGDFVRCGPYGGFLVYKSGFGRDSSIVIEGPLGTEYYEIIDQISLFMHL